MQQVRAGVVPRRSPAPGLVDLAAHRVADAQLARDLAEVRDGVTGALRVVDPKPATGADQLASVADLPAALGVERGAIEHDRRG